VSCGVDCRCGLDLVLLWLWCRLQTIAQIQPLAWEFPHAALKKKKKSNYCIGILSFTKADPSEPEKFYKERTRPSSHLPKLSFFFFGLFRAAPAAYGDSQARGSIRAAAAALCPSPSNARSEPHLQSTPQLTATPDA